MRLVWLPVLALMLAGCAGEPEAVPEVAEIHRLEIEAILAEDPSDFERRVLEDFRITDAEMREAQELFRECFEAQGFVVEFPDLGIGGMTTSPASKDFWAQFDSSEQALAAQDRAIDQCESGTTRRIEPAYLGIRENPEGWTYVEAARACMEMRGIAGSEGLSDDELLERLHYDNEFLLETPDGQACLIEPFKAAADPEYQLPNPITDW